MRKEVTVREGDRLWPLMETILDTHIDDLTASRIEELMAMVRGWRITHTDGRRLDDETGVSRRHKAPEGECATCDREREACNSFHPPHDASPNCESGKHNHCSCDMCF